MAVITQDVASSRRYRMTEPTNRQGRLAFIGTGMALLTMYAGNNLPSALYSYLRAEFGFSPLVQTELYAVVVAVILPGLLVFGPLSDAVGRKRLMVGGLLGFVASDLLFLLATGTPELFAARLLSGLGIAAGTASAQAALTETAGRFIPDKGRASRTSSLTGTMCVTGGLAIGPLLGGLLAQFLPAPTKLAFVVHIGLVLVVLTIVATTAPGRTDAPATTWRPARLRLPATVRQTFLLVSGPSALAWAVLGIFSALVPSVLNAALHTANVAVTAGGLALMIGVSALAQLAARTRTALRSQLVGLLALAVGAAALVGAVLDASPVLAAVAMLASGIGHGLIFVGSTKEIIAVAPPAQRGEVVSVVYAVNYVFLGVPTIAVGLLSAGFGLIPATEIAAVAITALAVVLLPITMWLGRRVGLASLT